MTDRKMTKSEYRPKDDGYVPMLCPSTCGRVERVWSSNASKERFAGSKIESIDRTVRGLRCKEVGVEGESCTTFLRAVLKLIPNHPENTNIISLLSIRQPCAELLHL